MSFAEVYLSTVLLFLFATVSDGDEIVDDRRGSWRDAGRHVRFVEDKHWLPAAMASGCVCGEVVFERAYRVVRLRYYISCVVRGRVNRQVFDFDLEWCITEDGACEGSAEEWSDHFHACWRT